MTTYKFLADHTHTHSHARARAHTHPHAHTHTHTLADIKPHSYAHCVNIFDKAWWLQFLNWQTSNILWRWKKEFVRNFGRRLPNCTMSLPRTYRPDVVTVLTLINTVFLWHKTHSPLSAVTVTWSIRLNNARINRSVPLSSKTSIF
jgi:hypothetical protein